MQQVHKAKITKPEKRNTKGRGGQGSDGVGMRSIYLPGLPACFASKGEEATENGSKTDNQGSC